MKKLTTSFLDLILLVLILGSLSLVDKIDIRRIHRSVLIWIRFVINIFQEQVRLSVEAKAI